jgi:hypothetical protein
MDKEIYTVETQTPLHTLDWYVKWFATFMILFAVVSRSAQLPLYDFIFSILGTAGWTYVGIVWHDRALMLLNGVVAVILTIGLVEFLV